MSGLFSPPPPPPPPPTPEVKPPAPLPDQNSPGALEAKRKAQQDILSRAGRSSTILTAPNQRGGNVAPDYSAAKLGSAA